MAPPTIPIAERLRRRSRLVAESGCVEWTGAVSHNGYGALQVGKTTRRVHTVAYELVNGPLPVGLQIDHLCRNRRCMNPEHLEAVTPRENLMRSNNHVARQATATQCLRGHEFTPENTIHGICRSRSGNTYATRSCRECRRAQQRTRRRT